MSLQAPDTEEFLEALPYRWSRSLLWAFLALILALGGWAATARVNVSVSGRGWLVPADAMPWVLSPSSGQVEGVRVRPGDKVPAGETILEVGQESVSLPQPGYIMAIRSVAGSQVSQGDPLIEYCTEDAQFAFEALVANQDVGRVSLGQAAFIHLDAFPVEQFGSIPAQVI
ncbi:MAG TPA: biotin/lipoyl-containing protein, partial [Candidatus Xenobia bacterium]